MFDHRKEGDSYNYSNSSDSVSNKRIITVLTTICYEMCELLLIDPHSAGVPEALDSESGASPRHREHSHHLQPRLLRRGD